MNTAAWVFVAGVTLAMAVGLWFSGERCVECDRRGPFVAIGRFGGYVCHRCHQREGER